MSGLCSVSVWWLSELRNATLAANSKPGAQWNTTKTKWTRWCWRCSPLRCSMRTRMGESVEGARLGCNGSAACEGLHLRPEEQGQISCGDRNRCAEIPRAVRETLREERTVSAPAVGFADVTEPFLSGKRVR